MKPMLSLIVASLILGGSAQGSEVYKVKDAQGNTVFTDRPDALPAQRLNVKTQQTDVVEARKRYDEEMQGYADADKAAQQRAAAEDKAKAGEPTDEQRTKACDDARARYNRYMNAQRLYEPGATDKDRRFLSDAELDAAREFARKSMEAACAEQ